MAAIPVKNTDSKPKIITGTEKQGSAKNRFSSNMALIFFLGFISLALYANTLGNGFVLDDNVAVKNNAIVKKGVAAIPELLATPYHRGWSPRYHDNLYRPLSLVMFSVEYSIFGLNPAPYHFVNILLFAGCVLLLFFFLDQLFGRKKTAVAFLASLLFALHPIHTEVVANIKSGDELLCFLFAFLCLNVLIKYVQTGKMPQLLTGAFCFLLSLLSKETAITFLAVIPVLFFFYRDENKKRSVYTTLSITAAAIIFLIARFSVLDHYHAGNYTDTDMVENALANPGLSLESRLATALLILGYYVKLLFIPYPLICDYSYNSIPYVHFSDPWVLCSLLVYLSLFVFSVVGIMRKKRNPYAFGTLFFLAAMSLFTNIPFLIGDTMAERFLFFGSAGFCLVVALVIDRLAGIVVMPMAEGAGLAALKNPKALAILLPLTVIHAGLTFNRNKDWSDNYTLYTTDLEKAPDDCRLNYFVADNLLAHLSEEKDNARQHANLYEALSCLNKAVEICPEYVNAHFALGKLYSGLHIFDSAETHYVKAYELNPKDIFNINSLANLYYTAKKYRQSIYYNKITIGLNPTDAQTYANTGYCYLNSGNIDSAILYANRAVAVDPKLKASYGLLAYTYKAAGNLDSSKKYEAIVLSYKNGRN